MALVRDTLLDEIFDTATAAGLHAPAFRDQLLVGIDPMATGLMPLLGIPLLQLQSDLNWCNVNERLADGMVPLKRWLENAAKFTSKLAQGPKFRAYVDQIGGMAVGQPPVPATALPESKEAILFESDVIPFGFLAGGAEAGKSVVQVSVPRFEAGAPAFTASGVRVVFNGSGWLLTPDLVVTNHHVVNARMQGESSANAVDFAMQGAGASVRFDFDSDGEAGEVMSAARVEAFSPLDKLDYAILRLPAPAKRSPLRLQTVPAVKDAPVNIIQHPDGGPKMIAVRNNMVTSSTETDLGYFTDTKFGSSGSPVFDDGWRVVALHRGSRAVENVKFQGKSTAFVNVGTQIAAILADVRASNPALAVEIGLKTQAAGNV